MKRYVVVGSYNEDEHVSIVKSDGHVNGTLWPEGEPFPGPALPVYQGWFLTPEQCAAAGVPYTPTRRP